MVSSFAIFGIAGIVRIVPFGNNVVPKGISLITSPIGAGSAIVTSSKSTESKVVIFSSVLASIFTKVSNSKSIKSS